MCGNAPDALEILGKPHHADIVDALAVQTGVQGKGPAAPARRAVEGDRQATIVQTVAARWSARKKAGYNNKVEVKQ